MPPRDPAPHEDEFDFTRLLWGESSLASVFSAELPADGGATARPPAPTSNTAAVREAVAGYGWEPFRPATDQTPGGGGETPASARRDSSEPDRSHATIGRHGLVLGGGPAEAEDARVFVGVDLAGDDGADWRNADAGEEPAFDLDAFVALEELSAAGDLAPEAFDDSSPDDAAEYPTLDEAPLSYGELTRRLEREVLPRLRGLAEKNGYLTLGYFARAVVDLQRSDAHLAAVRVFAAGAGVAILPSRSHQIGRPLPLWAVEEALRRFGDLVGGRPDEGKVLARFGYAGMALRAGTRAFLVQAWMSHCLSRAEETEHANTVAKEVARVGEDADAWSLEALAARDALILDNLWTVAWIARKYGGRGVDIDDLIQFGCLGLFRAVIKFDPSQGTRFFTYTRSWVFQAIMRAIGDTSRLIRLPIHLHDQGKIVEDVEDEMWDALGRAPTVGEVARESGLGEHVVRAFLVTSRPLSLDHPADEDVCSLGDLSEDRHGSTPDETVARQMLVEEINRILHTLSDRERRVLAMRFGLEDGRTRTLEELGHAFGVTRERIRQIEAKALRKLRHPSRTRKLRDYFSPSARNPITVEPDAVKQVMTSFDKHERAAIVALWGLDGKKRLTHATVARELGLPLQLVEGLVPRVKAGIALTSAFGHTGGQTKAHRAVKNRQSPTAVSALGGDGPIHPAWSLGEHDRSTEDWAWRLQGMHRPDAKGCAAPSDRPAAATLRYDGSANGAAESGAGGSAALIGETPMSMADLLDRAADDRPATDVDGAWLDGLPGASRDAILKAVGDLSAPRLRAMAEARLGLGRATVPSREAVMREFDAKRILVFNAEHAVIARLTDRAAEVALHALWNGGGVSRGTDASEAPALDDESAAGLLPGISRASLPSSPTRLRTVRDAISEAEWSAIRRAVEGLGPLVRRIAEARIGADDQPGLSRTATSRTLGVTQGPISFAERAILGGIADRSLRRRLEDYWQVLELLPDDTHVGRPPALATRREADRDRTEGPGR